VNAVPVLQRQAFDVRKPENARHSIHFKALRMIDTASTGFVALHRVMIAL